MSQDDSQKAMDSQLSPWEEAMQSQLDAWFLNPADWSDEAPEMQVTVGANALCQLDGTAIVAYPPDAVFSLVCDPYNHRVFKNVKAVRNHRVVRDCNGVKEVEMDMVFAFQLPFFSGSFDAHMRMVQDRPNRTMTFALTRPGFMRKFEGFWRVEPLLVPVEALASNESTTDFNKCKSRRCDSTECSNCSNHSCRSDGCSRSNSSCSLSADLRSDSFHSSSSSSSESEPDQSEPDECDQDHPDGLTDGKTNHSNTKSMTTNSTSLTKSDGIRVASRLVLRQIVQPSVAPPAIFKRCLHSILQLATRDVLLVFQQEAARLRNARGKEESEEPMEKKGTASLSSRIWGLLSVKA